MLMNLFAAFLSPLTVLAKTQGISYGMSKCGSLYLAVSTWTRLKLMSERVWKHSCFIFCCHHKYIIRGLYFFSVWILYTIRNLVGHMCSNWMVVRAWKIDQEMSSLSCCFDFHSPSFTSPVPIHIAQGKQWMWMVLLHSGTWVLHSCSSRSKWS